MITAPKRRHFPRRQIGWTQDNFACSVEEVSDDDIGQFDVPAIGQAAGPEDQTIFSDAVHALLAQAECRADDLELSGTAALDLTAGIGPSVGIDIICIASQFERGVYNGRRSAQRNDVFVGEAFHGVGDGSRLSKKREQEWLGQQVWSGEVRATCIDGVGNIGDERLVVRTVVVHHDSQHHTHRGTGMSFALDELSEAICSEDVL